MRVLVVCVRRLDSPINRESEMLCAHCQNSASCNMRPYIQLQHGMDVEQTNKMNVSAHDVMATWRIPVKGGDGEGGGVWNSRRERDAHSLSIRIRPWNVSSSFASTTISLHFVRSVSETGLNINLIFYGKMVQTARIVAAAKSTDLWWNSSENV